MCKDLHESFLQLVRLGIGHTESTEITEKVDWVALKTLAERQGLSAIVLDGLDAVNGEGLTVHGSMPQMLRLEWIGDVLQDYEGRYAAYEKAIGSLAEWYNQHGFKMMVLKGYACSLDWPKPEHRPCGDIDIWLFGQQREADTALGSWLKVQGSKSSIDNSHHHHTVFDWRGFMVENHYDFINVHHHKSHVKVEKILKEYGDDDSHSVLVCGEKMYLPSPNLHALFLIRHMMSHFAAAEISLRQVLDWAFFMEKQGKQVDWDKVLQVYDEFGMREFFNIINAICVNDLGFRAEIFPYVQYNSILKERVMNDIMSPEFAEEMPKRFFARVLWKIRRWKANEWKHKLCYKESMWSAFWSGVWGHLLKPRSI